MSRAFLEWNVPMFSSFGFGRSPVRIPARKAANIRARKAWTLRTVMAITIKTTQMAKMAMGHIDMLVAAVA
jgi:hypothetical protein